VPQPGQLTPADETLLAAARGLHARVREELEQQAFHKTLDALWQVIGDGDRYVNEQKPWSLKTTDPARMNTVLYVLAETVRHVAILAQPFMPQACGRLLDFLAVPADGRDFAALASRRLVPGTPLPPPEGVFPRYVEAGEGIAARS
jgi:methionyl-tRNA synthetase